MHRRRGLVVILLLAGCRPYGSIASLATREVRASAIEFAGRWRAPDGLRCESPGPGRGSRWSANSVFEVRGDDSGRVSVTALPDTACPNRDGARADTMQYEGALVRLGTTRVVELSLSDDRLDETLLPLRQWLRVSHVGDTLFLEALWGDSLEAWLGRSPGLTPHRFTSDDRRRESDRRLVLTGDAAQLQAFARKAFGTAAMIYPDTLVFVRDRPPGARGS